MSEIINKTNYSTDELIQINNCRIYLQVLMLSDITEGSGSQITTHTAEGIRDLSRVSTWKWPTIPYPPAQSWAKWRGTIKTTFLQQYSRYIRRPLGKWLNKSHQQWIWFLDQYNEVLCEKRSLLPSTPSLWMSTTKYIMPLHQRTTNNYPLTSTADDG